MFGLFYNYLFYPHSLTEFLEAGSISILIGLMAGFLEEYVFKRFFQTISFLTVSLIRSLIYSLLTSIILCLVLSIEISFVEQVSYPEAIVRYLRSPLFQRDFLFTFLFIMAILLVLEIILLIGRANFLRLILGSYHQPREVSKIFMFVDLKGSTTIAESLPNKEFSALIKDYFYDLSDAIMMFDGEIYQYVGDEIIVVWPIKGKEPKCIHSFFKMEEIINGNKSRYQARYGIIPEFKAGIHAGKVIVTSIGKQKKEIVYHGDVLNTASRIAGKCNELNQKLLISEDMLNYLEFENDFVVEEKGEIELKGKVHKLRLFGVKRA